MATVTLSLVSGSNGVVNKAINADEQNAKASVVEMAKMEISNRRMENEGRNISKSEFKEILKQYFDDVPDELPEDFKDFELVSKKEYGGNKVQIAEIWNEEFGVETENSPGTENPPVEEEIPKEEPLSGKYYASINGDGTVDGVIYADLAFEESGIWGGNGVWSHGIESGFKEYYVINKNYSGPFGDKPVLAPKGSGNNRFYIMDLADVGGKCFLYANATDQLENPVGENDSDFGKGKENTDFIKNKWDNQLWGIQSPGDLWNNSDIQNKLNQGWFVPSKSEWSAFGSNLEISSSSKYNLSNSSYWLSSVYDNTYSYRAMTSKLGIIQMDLIEECVRLSIRF